MKAVILSFNQWLKLIELEEAQEPFYTCNNGNFEARVCYN
jgi:hypothetical protein